LTPAPTHLYIPAVRRAIVALLICIVSGCASSSPIPRTSADAQLFAPVSMRIHPIFTQVKDWTGDGQPDGIEALLEFQDQFNDPTKAAGTAIFELFTYRPNTPDSRGARVVNPWVGTLKTLGEQQARWNRTSRTYYFQLELPTIKQDDSYVLAATFDTGATRFFDQIIMEGHRLPRDVVPATRPAPAPAPAPATRPATRPAGQSSAAPVVPTVSHAATRP
jgi:hypothetical protein